MIEVKQIHKEIAIFLKNEYEIDEIVLDSDNYDEREITFQLKPNCNGFKIKEALHEHFGNELIFYSTEISGILGILIEN